jgi:hypothetical protein
MANVRQAKLVGAHGRGSAGGFSLMGWVIAKTPLTSRAVIGMTICSRRNGFHQDEIQRWAARRPLAATQKWSASRPSATELLGASSTGYAIAGLLTTCSWKTDERPATGLHYT